MLSPDLVFVHKQAQDDQLVAYPQKFRDWPEACRTLSPIFQHHLVETPRSEGNRVMSRLNHPWAKIKQIYYTSIKQRERNCFRQLNLGND